MMVSEDLMKMIKQGFALRLDGIHGSVHWTRVRNNGLRLAKDTGANPEVVELFAFLHDSRRLNDGHDPQHGARAARFAARIRSSLLDLSDGDFEMLRFACEFHTDGLTDADVTVQTCWDADRLDLGRIGIVPDPRFLCTSAAKEPATIEWAVSQSRQR
jgi:uncharacterized protein